MLPHLVLPLQQQHIKTVACGNSHILALTDQGHVFSWYAFEFLLFSTLCRGANHNGCVGIGHTNRVSQPQRINSLSKYPISLIAAGWSHSLAYSGCLPPEIFHSHFPILQFNILQTKKAVCTSSCLRISSSTTSGSLWSWGSGSDGRLGLGKTGDQHAPALVWSAPGSH